MIQPRRVYINSTFYQRAESATSSCSFCAASPVAGTRPACIYDYT